MQKPSQSIEELRAHLTKILADTRTPGAAVGIVTRDGPEWVEGLGIADVRAGRPAGPDTLFRVGSVSKGFVSIAILMLAEQGRLSLYDPVRSLVPEIRFENPWEASDPVRVAHLLEHTTGWDDTHLAEYAKDAKGMSLREALDYHPDSRVAPLASGHTNGLQQCRPRRRRVYCRKVSGRAL